jgi:hypothetical protein
MKGGLFIEHLKQSWQIAMSNFVPTRICLPYDFDAERNRQGLWIVRDRCGLADGTFFTRKDALRFALFEAGGDTTHVHPHPAAKATSNAKRPHRRNVS